MTYNETKYNLNWNLRKLNALGSFARGKSKHRPRNDVRLFDGGGFPFVQTGEVKGSDLFILRHEQEYNNFGLKQSKLWDAGTLCITIAANIAETAILSYPACFPDSVVGFVADKKQSSELFMHYVFAFVRRAIQSSIGGSIQDNINIEYLENLNFRIPCKKTQDEIVDVLLTIDKKIQINNTINVELDKLARAIYEYWFVQFDFPDAHGKPYKSSGCEMVYNETLKREIPKGWQVLNINDWVRCEAGAQPPKSEHISEQRKGYIRFIQNRDYDDATKHLTYIPISNSNSVCDKYDIMMDKYGDAGRIRFGIAGAYNVALLKIVVTKKGVQEFIRGFLSTEPIYNYLNGACAASTRASLNSTTLDNLYFAVPPDDALLAKYEKQAKQHIDMVMQKKAENLELAALRDFLLPLLMNGQVTVMEPETE